VVDERGIAERFRLLSEQRVLDERGRRLWAAVEARSAGRGGIAAVVRATGISESTVLRGLADLESGEVPLPGRVRRHPGPVGIGEREPGLEEDLERLIDPVTRGDSESPLRWTSKSAAKLAEALRGMGHQVVDRTVLRLLKAKGYSLQSNRKTREGASHPDRDAQFEHINETVKTAIAAGEPVISVDTKKRELVGDFKAVGRELEPRGRPVEVRTHDFKDKQLGHAIPYGVYDLTADEGWVSIGITRDTATFAVNTILSWWEHLGRERYPNAKTLTITADCGGSNSSRTRLWKLELQRLADQTGLQIVVCHFPPGTTVQQTLGSSSTTSNRHYRTQWTMTGRASVADRPVGDLQVPGPRAGQSPALPSTQYFSIAEWATIDGRHVVSGDSNRRTTPALSGSYSAGGAALPGAW
jgi:Rhodopirellula transposase DDE domain